MTAKKPKPRRVAVLGAGPAGLAAAYVLANQNDVNVRVDVYEKTPRFGGSIASETGGGFTYELGANSMNAKHQPVADLIYDKLKLKSRVLKRHSEADNIFSMRDGQLIPIPRTPKEIYSTNLLSWRSKLRILLEPFVPRVAERDANLQTVAQFFGRRFGTEFVDYVIDPAVGGIFSTHAASLSMKHAMNRVWDAERRKGSVIGGFLLGGMKVLEDPRYNSYTSKQLRESFSYDQGMQVLTSTLVSNIQQPLKRGKLYNNSAVRSLDQDSSGAWRVNGRGTYDAVISTIPTYALAPIASNVKAICSGFDKLARRVKYAPTSVVLLGFDKSQVTARLDGYGVLFPKKESKRVLGINFSSSNFPTRADDPNKVYLTLYFGGLRSPEVVRQDPKEIVETATYEVQQLLGVKGQPFYSAVKSWPNGIPQYFPGYDRVLNTIACIERRAPGLVLGGNYRDGIGVPDALLSGIKSAERIIEYLKITLPK